MRHGRTKRKTAVLAIVFCLLPATLSCLTPSAFSNLSDPWPSNLLNWTYRKPIHIHTETISANATNYQIGRIKCLKATGTDSTGITNGNDVSAYLGSEVRDDFGDIRFTDGSGNPLDYYQQELSSGNYAVFWFKTNVSTTADSTCYIYFNNSAATYGGIAENVMFDVKGTGGGSKYTGFAYYTAGNSYIWDSSGAPISTYQGPNYRWRSARIQFRQFNTITNGQITYYSGSRSARTAHRKYSTGTITFSAAAGSDVTVTDPTLQLTGNALEYFDMITASTNNVHTTKSGSWRIDFVSGTCPICTAYTYTTADSGTALSVELACRMSFSIEPTLDIEATEIRNQKYYFNFQHHDIDNNVIDSLISWELYNGSQKLTYSEGDATLSSGTYTLKTLKEGHLLDSKDISTASYGNSTVSVNIQYKQHNHIASGYVCTNGTISTISIDSQSATNLIFSINATTTDAYCYVGLVGLPQDAYLNGNNFTSYTYISTTTPKHLYFAYTENGTYSFTFNPTLPPTPSTGGPSGGPATSFSKRLRITVTNHDEPVQQANVTVYAVPEDPAMVYYQFSDVFGRVTFRLKAGVYKIIVQHDVLGDRRRTVNLDSNYDLTIEYTDADEATGGPLSILPQWGLTSEQGLLFMAIPIGAIIVYFASVTLRSRKKWKYSYLE